MKRFKTEEEKLDYGKSIGVEDMKKDSNFTITIDAVRPEGDNDKCYFCCRPIGEKHAIDCATIRILLHLKLAGTVVVSIPSSLTQEERLEYAGGLYTDAIQLLSKEWETKEHEDSFQDYSETTPWGVDENIFLDELTWG